MDGSKPKWIQLVSWGGVLGTQSDGYSITSPADSPHPGMLAVGAGSPLGVYSYSSRGPTPDGRVKPDIVGAAGTQTVARGQFHGTSAAAPHVGGLAALVVQQNPSFAPTEVTGYLKTHAIPNGHIVPNSTWGHGFARLPSPSCAEDLNGSGTTSGSWTNDCASAADSAKSGRYYNIRVSQESTVTIDLSSSVDSYLNLRNGYNAQKGAALHHDDNGGTGNNARISATLAAGTYTIEATTAANSQTGAFSLAVSGLAAVPEVSLSGGADVNEGSNVRFTLTASPIPGSPLPVKVQVSVTGDYGVTPSTRTINIPTSTGSTQLVLSTANDNVAEANGGITATLVKGAGYDVSSSASAATVGVNDNDNFSCHDLVTADGSIDGTLVTNCKQSFYSESSKRYARFYSFEIAQPSGVVIEMESTELNPYLMLRQGKDARTGTPLHFNDNAGESQNPPGTALIWNARIAEALSAGWYTIEASSLDLEETGSFKMQILGLSPQTSVPVISIAGGGDITEGEGASFTLTASPAPADDLNVIVSVAQVGDFATTIPRTVTIPTTGSATLTVFTDDDSIPEAHGSITAAIDDGNGYAVSSTISVSERTGAGIATVNVADDDGGICTEALTSDGSVSGTWADDCNSQQRGGSNARYYIFELEQSSKVTIDLTSWADTYMFLRSGKNTQSGQPLHENDDVGGGNLNSRISETLAAGWYTIEATTYTSDVTGDFSLTITGLASQPTEPEISIAAGGGVTEGAAASFTVTASPEPAADLDVTVSVSQSGDYGATTGLRTITIPASGSETFTVATTNDSADEADGSVTATVSSGTGYTVSTARSAATVAVSDDDDPVPVVSIVGGSAVTEGGSATFTLSASPAPAAPLTVNLAVSQSGDFYVGTGPTTVQIATSGTHTLSLGTRDDSIDEADGSMTVTLSAGTGYTVSSTQGAATVAVSDDDVPEISVAAGGGVVEGSAASFTLTATPKPAAGLDVTVAVSQSGDFGAATGSRTVSIPTSGSFTLTVATANDATDEADGSVTATVSTGTGYTVSSSLGSASVAVSDDDDPPPPPPPADCVSDETLELARDYYELHRDRAPGYGRNWRRVLVAFGDVVDDQLTAFTAAEALEGEQRWFGWKPFREALECIEAASQKPPPPPPDPEISIAAGSGVTEGSAASFTLTASPAPTAALTVDVTVSQSGDFGVATGARTVTISTSGSYTLTIATTGDSVDEADGSVTVSVSSGTGYTVSSSNSSATVSVSDDDDPPPPPPPPPPSNCVSDETLELARDYYDLNRDRAPGYGRNWRRVLVAFGDVVDDQLTPFTAAEALEREQVWFGWKPFREALECIEAARQPSDPEISVAAGSGVTEGSSASFTVTASPAPTAALTVDVTVSQSGDFGVTTGASTVTIPTTGTFTLTVDTTGDSTDEADGSVTVTVDTGTGYTVSSSAGSATVAVSDDDPAPPPPPPAEPEISIAAGSDVTEGAAATFTLTASPAPTTALSVSVTVSQSGDYGVSAGARTVTIPTGGTYTLTVATTNDSVDEADGSVTATVGSGTGYTVSATQSAATVAVSDDDDPAPPPNTPVISIVAGPAVTEGGNATYTLTASPAPTAPLTVNVTISQSGNYYLLPGPITIQMATSGTHTLRLGTRDDSTDEPDGSLTVTVDSGTGYTVSSSAGAATVAVSDNDLPSSGPLTLSVAGASANEGDSRGLRFVATLSKASDQEIKLGYGAWDISAKYNQDFTIPYRTFTISPGDTEVEIVVPIVDDDVVEGSETLRLYAYDSTFTIISGFTYAIGTIIDND